MKRVCLLILFTHVALGALAQAPFITTWQTTAANESITIPTTGSGYSYRVDWGDGRADATVYTGDATHTYATAGTYEVSISGNFPRIYFNSNADRDKIIAVKQWGDIAWTSMQRAFLSCSNLTLTATDVPDLSNVTDISLMFTFASSFNGDVHGWDVSNITNMSYLFAEATSFNQDISDWDVSHVEDMSFMFLTARSFSQDLGDWDISSVRDMNYMLSNSGLSLRNYEATLAGWATLDAGEIKIPTGITLEAAGLRYCDVTSRNALTAAYNWTISSDILQCPFITTWHTTTARESITIPTFTGEVYRYTVDWGDDSTDTTVYRGNATHAYATAGTYAVSISGIFPRIYFNSSSDKDKILTVEKWGASTWTSMNNAFHGCSRLTVPATDAPDLSTVTNMSGMFAGASSFNQNISHWDVSSVTNMSYMFYHATSFNQDISGWDVRNVTDMASMFYASSSFNQDIGGWDVSRVTDMSDMFNNTRFNQDIGNWNVSSVTNMSGMFYFATYYNQDLSDWDVRSVTDMSSMFFSASSFNQDIGRWDVSHVTNMFNMLNSTSFNQDISGWNVSNVTNMSGMFSYAHHFNQDIGGWDVSHVTSMNNMFAEAQSFNANISHWDVSKVMNMSRMLFRTSSFNQNIGGWNVSSATDMSNMLDESGLSQQNYEATLTGWATLDAGETRLPTNIALGATGLTYCDATHRNTLVNTYRWTITGDAKGQCPFITTWRTTAVNESITIPTTGGGYSYQVDWGDGSTDGISYTGPATHNYAAAGTYTVSIKGNFPRIFFDNKGDKNKILTVERWGDIAWTSMQSAFNGCSNLTFSAVDAPDLSNVTNMSGMFALAISFNQDIGHWDVSHVTSMSYMFGEAASFNQDIGDWDVGNVTDMAFMFYRASSFNQDIGDWEVRKVKNMYAMFGDATSFNQNIGRWDVVGVTDMTFMFYNASSFNQEVGRWNVSNVKNMSSMFSLATSFNQDIGRWDISSITDMSYMLNNTNLSKQKYEATLTRWATLEAGETKIPTTITLGARGLRYCDATSHNSLINIYNWTISDDKKQCPFVTTWQTTTANESITIPTQGGGYGYRVDWGDGTSDAVVYTGDATHTYGVAGTYTVSISDDFPHIYFNGSGDKDKILTVEEWGDIAWTSMQNAFYECSNLTVPATGAPNLSNVTDLSGMFTGATAFNQDVSRWDVSHITDMSGLFARATSFNQDISGWDVSNVTKMEAVFAAATSFDQNISGWDVSHVTDMAGMFTATSFNQNISSWNVSRVVDMSFMFGNATSFNHDIGGWDISSVTSMSDMLNNSGLSVQHYEATLAGWASLEAGETKIPVSIALGAAGLAYCEATHHNTLTDTYNWTISGDARKCAFITTWQTTAANESITIPIVNESPTIPPSPLPVYSYTVDWGDGSADATVYTGDATHTYTTAGLHRVSISGVFPQIFFYSSSQSNRDKIIAVEQWGTNAWTSMLGAFVGCSNLSVPATDAPDLSNVTDATFMFDGCSVFNQPVGHWDVSHITIMDYMFRGTAFNQDISGWDVSHVTNIAGMFSNTPFNQDIGGWNMSSARDMVGMFENAAAFNQDIGDWDLRGAENISLLFFSATSFNQDIGRWNVSHVKYMDSTFGNATAFNQDIGRWDVSHVDAMTWMFSGATSFNQNISDWDVSNVIDMMGMFTNATSFNQDISRWNVGNLRSMASMFRGATAFNRDISGWDVRNVAWMQIVFQGATSFNQDIGNWDVSSVTVMRDMLRNSGLSLQHYEATLAGWATLDPGETTIPTGIGLGATGLSYCDVTYRNTLLNTYHWTITGDTRTCTPVLAAIGDRSVDENVQLTFTASATDGDAGSLTFSLDAASLATGMTIDPASGAFGWTPGESNIGVHHVTITVSDGALTDSETFAIAVNAVSEAPTGLDLLATSDSGIDTDDITNDSTPTISGLAEAGSTVILYDGITEIGSTTADAASGVWQITSSVLADGTRTITATAADAAGNVSTSSAVLSITIDSVRPVVVLTSASAPKTNTPFIVIIEFSEGVAGFDLSDIDVTNGNASQFVATGTSHYSVLITPALPGPVTISVSDNSAMDIAANGNNDASLSREFDDKMPEGYTISFASEKIDAGNATNASLIVVGAEVGATYYYTITSENGGDPVTGSGIVTAAGFTIAGLDLGGLQDGVLTAIFYLQDDIGNRGIDQFAHATKETRKSEINIFTSFSPNGDGINDIWALKSLVDYKDVEVEVFDRAGVRVFYTKDPDQGWDGRNHNGLVLTGGYLYVVQVRDIKFVKKGVLTLLK